MGYSTAHEYIIRFDTDTLSVCLFDEFRDISFYLSSIVVVVTLVVTCYNVVACYQILIL